MKFIPNEHQQNVFNHITTGGGHLVVEACAGSGKTVTIIEALNLIPKTASVLLVAFNKHIKVTMEQRAPPQVDVKTFHSLGLSAISRYNNKFPKVSTRKPLEIFYDVVKEMNNEAKQDGRSPAVPDDWMKEIMSPVFKLVDLFRATLIDQTIEGMTEIMEKYSIDSPCESELLLEITKSVLARSTGMTNVVDFEDMIYLPVFYNMSMRKYDYVFVDETQDLNVSQVELLLKCLHDKSTVVAVGDRKQSLYGFRGADTESIPNIINTLNATVLPLSITYRCPTSHVKLAQSIVPAIEAAPDAKKGSIEVIREDDMIDNVSAGDLCICRNNAPLVRPAFKLIKEGVNVIIKGQDIGRNLLTIINKMKTDDMKVLGTKLENWFYREYTRLQSKDKNPEVLEDKYECILGFMENVSSVPELKSYIKNIFSDTNGSEVTFSSIHRAKGLEAENVFIIQPELMPSRWAKQDWEYIQEENCMYVAYTRSKNKLFMVTAGEKSPVDE